MHEETCQCHKLQIKSKVLLGFFSSTHSFIQPRKSVTSKLNTNQSYLILKRIMHEETTVLFGFSSFCFLRTNQ
jgi:hypothetical protein